MEKPPRNIRGYTDIFCSGRRKKNERRDDERRRAYKKNKQQTTTTTMSVDETDMINHLADKYT